MDIHEFKGRVFDASVLGGVSGKRKHVITKDLSRGGLLFESEEPFEIATILKPQVDIPGWEKYRLEFRKHDELSGRHPLVTLEKLFEWRMSVAETLTGVSSLWRLTADMSLCRRNIWRRI